MSHRARRRIRLFRKLSICAGLITLVAFASGCCTCKVKPYQPKTLLIVKQQSELNPDQYQPEGALINFLELNPGDKLLVVNRYGKRVEVDFPADIIEGERVFFIDKCESREVTIKSDTAVTEFFVRFDGPGDDHGGADMIIDPGGGDG